MMRQRQVSWPLQSMVAHSCNTGSQEAEAGGARVMWNSADVNPAGNIYTESQETIQMTQSCNDLSEHELGCFLGQVSGLFGIIVHDIT